MMFTLDLWSLYDPHNKPTNPMVNIVFISLIIFNPIANKDADSIAMATNHTPN